VPTRIGYQYLLAVLSGGSLEIGNWRAAVQGIFYRMGMLSGGGGGYDFTEAKNLEQLL